MQWSWRLLAAFSIGHFFLWKYIGENQLLGALFLTQQECQHVFSAPVVSSAASTATSLSPCPKKRHTSLTCHKRDVNPFNTNSLQPTSASSLHHYRGDALITMKFPVAHANIINFHPQHSCTKLVSPYIARNTPCIAIVTSSTSATTLPALRFNFDTTKTGKTISTTAPQPAGFFRNVASVKGRVALATKLQPLLNALLEVESMLVDMLEARHIERGDDITVLVTNDGEMDLLLNYVCSCRHHKISMNNVVVFAGSKEIVPLLHSAGLLAIFHPSFASVSRDASRGYLDKIFVDMMWYKAFAVWLPLSLGYNVLFQDLDIVWFRSPFEYFHAATNTTPPIAYLSDDGQRSLRYSPYFANSGFYYLTAVPQNIYLAWSIMLAFDTLQATGSHQNVFTMVLQERLDMSPYSPHRMLTLEDFPSGVKYHHDKRYMHQLAKGNVKPYMFHMCWTANKSQKITNFRNVSMWYLQHACQAPSLKSGSGAIYKKIVTEKHSKQDVTDLCCAAPTKN